MKRNILIIASGIIIFCALIKFGFFDALLLFLLVGAVPGTNFIIPPSVMFILTSTIALYVIAQVVTRQAFYAQLVTRLKNRYTTYRSRLPKRRYSEI
ncbi:MAG TPA: hypothetical protein VF281_03370 [Candidatus Saccharimonadales bacterium]